MNAQELDAEWTYRMEERLGIMCGMDEPTAEQFCIAVAEADEAMEKLKQQQYEHGRT